MKRLGYIVTALMLTLVLAVFHDAPISEAAVGDIIHQIGNPALGQPPLPFPGAANFCSIGLAFDGTSLYYNRCNDPNIYRINPLTAALVDVGGDGGIFNPGIAQNPNALAFDAKRNGLWIGAQNCNQTGMPIHFWDFDDNSVTLMFTIPFGLINPATGNSFLGFCFIDGLAYNENDPNTDADDEIWFSDDVNPNLGRFRATACPGPSPCGDLATGHDATTVDPSLATLSGLAVGGPNLYMANDGGGDVFRASIPALVLVDQFVSADERQEDMECDPVTFAPTEVMWVRTTPQGGLFPDVMTAYEIEPKTCGLGGQPPAEQGRMTGGGSVFQGSRVTHGFELHCDVNNAPNNLQVNWNGNRFHLEALMSAACSDDPNIGEAPPVAGFDTYVGSGTGRYNGASGATIDFTLTDAGEPGGGDSAEIVITDVNGNNVLTVSGFLNRGNHQAHKE